MRKYLSGAALAIGVVLVTAFLPTTAAQATQPNGTYRLYVNSATGLCMQANALNAQVTLNSCTGGANQAWSLSLNTRLCCGYTYFQFIDLAYGTCLGVRNGQAGVKGTAVVAGGCADVSDQYWAQIPTGCCGDPSAQPFRMVNWGTTGVGYCIDANNYSALLTIQSCSHSTEVFHY